MKNSPPADFIAFTDGKLGVLTIRFIGIFYSDKYHFADRKITMFAIIKTTKSSLEGTDNTLQGAMHHRNDDNLIQILAEKFSLLYVLK